MYATVLIDISSKNLNRLFDYKIPQHLQGKVKKGMRVVVDFNNAKRLAFVIEVVRVSKYSTKEILHVLDKKPILTNAQFKVVEHLQKKSFSSYVDAFLTVVPQALHGKYEYTFEIIDETKIYDNLKYAVNNNVIDIKKVKEEDFYLFNKALKNGYLKRTVEIKDKGRIVYTKKLFVVDETKKLTTKQALIVEELTEPKLIEELISLGHSKNIINRLINNGVLDFELVEKYKKYEQDFSLSEDVIKLTTEQTKAINNVKLNKSQKYLLFGPPGSGKTEVYLRLIKKVLNDDKQVLILVPEISLIPQMVSRVKGRFSDVVVVYHSGLSARERYETYRRTKSGEAKIVIGTRSSIFLPVDDVGLIVLDEAHDMSYLQKNAPYYDTLDLSSLLSELKKIPVIYGTATPNVNLYFEANLGKVKLLKLSKPIAEHKVDIKLIDMKEELIKGNLSMFSNELKEAINKTISNNEQMIILVNRRGYAPFVLCRTCGFVYKCPNCEISLVYHKRGNLLRCHHCGYSKKMEERCSLCKNKSVKPVGFGSEQVEEELLKEFPDLKIVRMDSDTTSRKSMHDKLLTKFLNQEANCLLGTQMVSKGHHFENVSLVVVMLADQMLKLSSYLANEKTFNLLTQHLGRIRKKDGTAILQAYDTNHFVLKSVKKNSYKMYYEEELQTRKLLRLEPFYSVVKVTFKGKDRTKTYNDLNRLKNNFVAKNSEVDAYGPSENYIFYLNGRYHYSVTFKIPKSFNIDNIMNHFDRRYSKEYYIDIDYYPEII